MTEKIELGYSHIIYEEHPAAVYGIFSKILSKGVKGLCITSTYPKKLTRKYDLGASSVIWVSETRASGAVNPQRLDFEIARTINKFIDNNKGGVILIDCVEFLVLSNGFEKIRKYMKKLIDTASINDITLLVAVNPDSFSKEKLTTFARDFDKVLDLRSIAVRAQSAGRAAEAVLAKKGAVRTTREAETTLAQLQQAEGTTETDYVPTAADIMAEVRGEDATEEAAAEAETTTKAQAATVAAAPVGAPPGAEAVPEHEPAAVAEKPKEDWYNLGVAADRAGNYEEAIQYYDKVLRHNPQDVRSLFNKGVDLLMLGRAREALDCFNKALEVNPNDAELWSNKGIALRSLGMTEEAIKCYDRALQLNPRDAGVWSNKGVALRSLGKIEEAIKCYDRALQLNPRDAGVWSNKGVALHKLGRLKEAIECYDRALAIDPNRRTAKVNKEYALRELAKR